MKFIAHRGACLEAQEDTLEALNRGAEYGAYAVECDPCRTADGVDVIYHDSDLKRLTGDPRKVAGITFSEMKSILSAAGKTLTTLDDVITGYHGDSAVLFDLPRVTDPAYFKRLADAPFHAIAGIHAEDEAVVASRYFPVEDILAFLPDPRKAADFAAAGAGNIRLWEQWLPEHPISEVRKTLPTDREIWIMSCDPSISDPLLCMNSSEEQIRRLAEFGADGILLNDIALMKKFDCPHSGH